MLEDINFANHMYTKISDLNLTKSISDTDDKLKYNENNFNRMLENSNFSQRSEESNFNNRNSDLDYLYYEESKV